MKKTFLFIAAASVMLTACKGGQNEPTQPEQEQEQEQTQTEPANVAALFAMPVVFNGTFVEVTNALITASRQQRAGAPAALRAGETYPQISWTPQDGTWPIDLTVNYGKEAVIGTDGLEHSGVMKIHATGLFETPNTVLTPTFTGFYVYGTTLTGTQTIQNTGKNKAGNLVFDVVTKDGKLGAGKNFIYSEHTSRELIKGLGENGFMAPDVKTHTYSITGTMKTVSQIDTIPGCEVLIDNLQPMVIAVGDLYPTDGLLHLTLDKGMSQTMEGFTLSISKMDLTFTGKNEQNQYGASFTATATMTTPMGSTEQKIAASFLLDKSGIIPGSVQMEGVDIPGENEK